LPVYNLYMDDLISITVRFYEELNDFIKTHPGKQDITFSFSGKRSVKDLIESLGVPHVEVDLILVNSESVDFDYSVQNGDRISVYPMFERFNINRISLLRDYTLLSLSQLTQPMVNGHHIRLL